ncbi:MAG: hypothetical protein QXY74_03005 [Candidatus Bathyarchaeia archaeon]
MPHNRLQHKIEEIIDTGLTVVVKVGKVYTGKNCVVGQALINPYLLLKHAKKQAGYLSNLRKDSGLRLNV